MPKSTRVSFPEGFFLHIFTHLHIYNLYFEYLYTNITKSLLCTFANSFATVMGPYPEAVNKHVNSALYRESLLYLSVIRGTSVI